jgi:hypothetical protein
LQFTIPGFCKQTHIIMMLTHVKVPVPADVNTHNLLASIYS